jgi:hypothetical protein
MPLLTLALDSIFYASLIVIPFSRLSGSCLRICEKKAQVKSSSSGCRDPRTPPPIPPMHFMKGLKRECPLRHSQK